MQQEFLTPKDWDAMGLPEPAFAHALSSRGFWLRNGFVLVYLAATAFSILFCPDELLSKFHFPLHFPASAAHDYLRTRLMFGAATMAVYLISYWRDWFFPTMACLSIGLAAFNLFNDVITLYVFVKAEALWVVEIIIGLRVLIILFFTMNYFNAAQMLRRNG